MDLKEFVSETLKEIIAGVKDAQVFAAENEVCINPNQFRVLTSPRHVLDMGDGTVSVVQPVQFDVCVAHTKKVKPNFSTKNPDYGISEVDKTK